jgi:hypothetical protein
MSYPQQASNDIQKIGAQFHTWKEQNPQRRIPKRLWDCALDLIPRHSIHEVAKAIGFSVAYIRHKKLKAKQSSNEFVAVLPQTSLTPLSSVNNVKMNIQCSQGIAIELAFQGSLDLAFPLISMLFKEQSSCSK